MSKDINYHIQNDPSGRPVGRPGVHKYNIDSPRAMPGVNWGREAPEDEIGVYKKMNIYLYNDIPGRSATGDISKRPIVFNDKIFKPYFRYIIEFFVYKRYLSLLFKSGRLIW